MPRMLARSQVLRLLLALGDCDLHARRQQLRQERRIGQIRGLDIFYRGDRVFPGRQPADAERPVRRRAADRIRRALGSHNDLSTVITMIE